jgi:hypothetical protein
VEALLPLIEFETITDSADFCAEIYGKLDGDDLEVINGESNPPAIHFDDQVYRFLIDTIFMPYKAAVANDV